jgi:mono/diheme cytochrome c family protein
MWKLISLVVITIAGVAPALAAASFDVPQLAGAARSDAFIIDRTKNAKEGAMPAFEGALSNRQIKAIVTYIRNLKDTSQ